MGLKACLMIMHAREIPSCVTSFKELDMPKVWFRGFTEAELEMEVSRFVDKTDYGFYFMCSDDMIVTQQTADLLIQNIDGRDVLTGYCNLTPFTTKVNVRLSPFTGSYGFFILTHAMPGLAKATDYFKYQTFPEMNEIKKQPEFFRTYFMGYAFSGMTRDLWRRFPPKPWKNHLSGKSFGSDYLICRELNRLDIPIWCHRDAFIYHLNSRENFIVGKVPPEVIHQPGS